MCDLLRYWTCSLFIIIPHLRIHAPTIVIFSEIILEYTLSQDIVSNGQLSFYSTIFQETRHTQLLTSEKARIGNLEQWSLCMAILNNDLYATKKIPHLIHLENHFVIKPSPILSWEIQVSIECARNSWAQHVFKGICFFHHMVHHRQCLADF